MIPDNSFCSAVSLLPGILFVSLDSGITEYWQCRDGSSKPEYAPIPPPTHPTFDLDAVRLHLPLFCVQHVTLVQQRYNRFGNLIHHTQVVQAALDEDSAGIGDVTTLSTYVLPPSAELAS